MRRILALTCLIGMLSTVTTLVAPRPAQAACAFDEANPNAPCCDQLGEIAEPGCPDGMVHDPSASPWAVLLGLVLVAFVALGFFSRKVYRAIRISSESSRLSTSTGPNQQPDV